MINCSTRSGAKYAASSLTNWTWLFHLSVCLAGSLAIAPQAALAQVYGTPGKDGTASPSGAIDTYYPGTGTASAGSSEIGIGISYLSWWPHHFAWNGTSGGVVAIDVYNTLDFDRRSIDVTGQCFRGGGSRDLAYWYCL